jgi:dihydrodipicolinate synthase/N-acetylneuraminate lyase
MSTDAGADRPDRFRVMAMPPYVRHPGPEEIVDFYAEIARAAELPVWIQDYVPPMGTPMPPPLLARLLREIPGVDYLKEETAFAPQVMTQVKALAGDALKGMMGGMAGRYLLEEYRRGAGGTMPASEVADAHVAVWELLEAGQDAEARRRFTQLLPLLNLEAMYSFTVYKEVLYRRGVIACPKTRAPGAAVLDSEASRELDLLLQELAPLLTVGTGTVLPPSLS